MRSLRFMLLGFLLITLGANPAMSHKEWVHQHMVKHAYYLLQSQLGCDIPQMGPFVGLGVDGPGTRMWRTRTIVNGAWREDMEDPVWHTGECSPSPCIAPGWDASSCHFWDADAGDYSTIDIPQDGFGGIGNAFCNASAILNPSISPWYVYYRTDQAQQWQFTTTEGINYTIPNLVAPTSAIGIQYNSLVDFYLTGHAWVVGYVGISGDWVTGTEDPRLPFQTTFGQYYRDEVVWEALGRVAHLIADMSVPAHVHNDIHPCYVNLNPA